MLARAARTALHGRRLPLARGPPLAALAMRRSLPLSTSPQVDGHEVAGEKTYEEGLEQLDVMRLAEAVKLFAKAAEAGHAGGNFYLGLAYDGLLGEDARGEPPVEGDPEAAARCYLRAGEAGHTEAMLNLSLCYRNGEGVPRNTAEAFKWVERGAEAGSDRAQFNAGVALDPEQPPWGVPGETGPNAMLPKDPTRAVAFYRQAVEQGHAKVAKATAHRTSTAAARLAPSLTPRMIACRAGAGQPRHLPLHGRRLRRGQGRRDRAVARGGGGGRGPGGDLPEE